MKAKIARYALSAMTIAIMTIVLSGCGPTHTYWGVHSEYDMNGNPGYYPHYYGNAHPQNDKAYKKWRKQQEKAYKKEQKRRKKEWKKHH